jgi:putative peptidoglycan lipid II flippase
MAAFLGAKVVGLLRERAIAHQFGATTDYDAYVAAFKIPDLIFTLIAGGALVSAFLPVFADALARHDDDEAWTVASGMTNLILVTTAALALLAAIAAPWLVGRLLAPGFDAAQQALTVSLMRIVLVSSLVFAVSGIQMGILNAYQHFLTPALAPIAYNLGIIAGALWFTPRWGIRGLAWGVVLGAVLHLVVKIPALVRYGFRYVPTFGLGQPGVRQVLWLMWPRVLGLGTVQLAFLVNTRLASDLPAGSLSALNYAWVLSQMPQTLLGTAIGTVAFPTFAEQAALGQREALRSTLAGILKVMVALSVPAAAALWVLGGPAINVLLVTGRFDARAAAATLLALRMFALGLVGHVTLEAVARAFYAQKDTLTPLCMAAGAMALQIALALALVGPLAQGGLALANSVAVTVEVVAGLWLLRRRLGGGVPG